MSRNLRQRSRICYYEPDEPNLDEYIFCSECGDYVYEYCAIHGPLLVIPDDKVPEKTGFPAFVPRAALTIPHVFLNIAPSYIPDAGLGVFATLTLPKGVRFGPYTGIITKCVESNYCWQIYDANRKPAYVVDATDPDRSNWMRYVNCSRHSSEQNLLAFQYKKQLYYRTTKIIPKNTELLVYYGSEFANRLGINLHLYNTSLYKKAGSEPETKQKATKRPFDFNQKSASHDKNEESDQGNNVKITFTHPPISDLRQVLSLKSNTSNIYTNGALSKTTGDDNNENLNANFNTTGTSEKKIVRVTKKSVKTEIEIKNLKSVVQTNTVDQPYESSESNNSNNGSDHLKVPVQTHTGEKPNKCSVCSFSCTDSGSLKRHMRTHTGEKPYKCSVCSYSCTQSSSLKTHMRTHTGEKPYKCSVCSYSCNQSSHLKTHMRTHTGEKPYKCAMCSYSCNHSSDLKKHMRTHTGEKPYKCSVCSYSCTVSSHLKIHMRTHTGEKPYKCSVCSYSSNESRNLKRHMRTHTGEKPYKCSVCSYSCNRNDTLKTHMRTHTGEKPYKRSVCSYSCTVSGSLKTHIMRNHTGEEPFKS